MADLEARNHVERVLSVAHNEAAVIDEPGIAESWRRRMLCRRTTMQFTPCFSPFDGSNRGTKFSPLRTARLKSETPRA